MLVSGREFETNYAARGAGDVKRMSSWIQVVVGVAATAPFLSTPHVSCTSTCCTSLAKIRRNDRCTGW